MKVKNITNPTAFFETIEKCKGKILLTTEDGDQLNLKSKLCQYIALTSMMADARIGEIEILVSEPEDLSLILNFLVRG